MSLQRRRGEWCLVYPEKDTVDRAGDPWIVPDLEADPIKIRAAFIPQRGSKVEMPGQQQINVYTMILPPDVPGFGMYCRVAWAGREWDVVTPIERHHGTRRTRHWTVSIRQRPVQASG